MTKQIQPPDQTPAWGRQECDTARSFVAFCVYRDSGPARTLKAAYSAWCERIGRKREAKTTSGHWRKWSSENNWVDRCAAYDLHILNLERLQREQLHLDEIAQYREAAKAISIAGLSNAMIMLNQIKQRLDYISRRLDLDESAKLDKDIATFQRAASEAALVGMDNWAIALGIEKLSSLLQNEVSQI